MIKRQVIVLLAALAVLLCGCSSNNGPDLDSLPPLETAPAVVGDDNPAFSSSETILIYQEKLSGGVLFQLYEDGRLVLSGGDLDSSIGKEKAYTDYRDSISAI